MVFRTYKDLYCLLSPYFSNIFCNFASSKQYINFIIFMEPKIKTYGRSELAQLYFPTLLQKSAWQKLKSWLQINPALRSLADLSRRTYTPAEVELIFSQLGEP